MTRHALKVEDTVVRRERQIEASRQQLAQKTLGETQRVTSNGAHFKPGGLAASGLLYEGADLGEWKKRMTTILRARHGSVPAELDVTKLHLSIEQARELIECDASMKAIMHDVVSKEAAKAGRDAAVKRAIDLKDKSFSLQQNARDVAFAKIQAVQRAVRDSPQRSVKEVWEVAQEARPSPSTKQVSGASIPGQLPAGSQVSNSGPPTRAATSEQKPSLSAVAAGSVTQLAPVATPKQRAASMAHVEPSQHEQIADIKVLCDHISPSLRNRIPDWVKSNLKLFWTFIDRLAQPFHRVRELSVLVRNQIYRSVFNNSGNTLRRQLREPLPALLAVCREVREEARPVFFACSGFDYKYGSPIGGMHAAITTDLRQWLQVVVRSEAKHLRDVRVNLRPSNVDGDKRHILFSLQPVTGLTAKVLGKDQSLEKTLQEAVAHVEDIRRLMGMQGEAIGMALLSPIWQAVLLSSETLEEQAEDCIVKPEEDETEL